MAKHKVNKGEWAELYVFLSALATGSIYAADENLNRIEDICYTILKAIKIEDDVRKEYSRDMIDNLILVSSNGEHIVSLTIQEFLDKSLFLLETIKNGSGRTFEIPEIEDFLEEINVDKIKAKSDSKKDLIFQIHDNYTGFEPEIGFSIKSYIGGSPTLLNSSGATVFSFDTSIAITEDFVKKVNNIDSRTKIKDRVQYMSNKGIELQYSNLSSDIFKRNLMMIDTRMPEILAYLCLSSYFVQGKKISDVVSYFCKKYDEDEELIEHKVKDLLVASALGMEPNTKWSGIEDANGGYIVVKNDGEILCYHIYDRNKLREYLYRSTKFDTPSTGRTGSGELSYKSDKDSAEFKLSLQIRF